MEIFKTGLIVLVVLAIFCTEYGRGCARRKGKDGRAKRRRIINLSSVTLRLIPSVIELAHDVNNVSTELCTNTRTGLCIDNQQLQLGQHILVNHCMIKITNEQKFVRNAARVLIDFHKRFSIIKIELASLGADDSLFRCTNTLINKLSSAIRLCGHDPMKAHSRSCLKPPKGDTSFTDTPAYDNLSEVYVQYAITVISFKNILSEIGTIMDKGS